MQQQRDVNPEDDCKRCRPIKEMLVQRLASSLKENKKIGSSSLHEDQCAIITKFTKAGMCEICRGEAQAIVTAANENDDVDDVDSRIAAYNKKYEPGAGSATVIKPMKKPAATETHQYWSRRGPEPCPNCFDPSSEEILETQNVPFGQYRMKRCKKCQHRWTCSVAEDPD